MAEALSRENGHDHDDAPNPAGTRDPGPDSELIERPLLLPPIEIGLAPLACEIVHRVPGRLRLRVPRLKREPELAERVLAFLTNQPGIESVRVSLPIAALIVTYERSRVSPPQVLAWVGRASTAPVVRTARASPVPRATSLLCAGAALALSVIGAPAALTLGVLAVGALPIAARAARSLIQERRLTVDVLDVIALSVLGGQGSLLAASLATSLIEGGEYIRGLTARTSGAALAELLSTRGRTAWVLRGQRRERVPVDALAVGDTVVVYPGEMIPVDGTVVRGSALVDQKTLTGEAVPVWRTAGQTVYASTIVAEGKLYLGAEKVGAATRAGQIVRMLESAPEVDTRIANYARRFADRLVLPTLLLSGGVYAFTGNLSRAVAILIFDLATGIRVSAPTAVLASMTAAARHHVLIKGGHAIERLAALDVLVFDKTGTLTSGTPGVVDIVSFQPDRCPDEVLRLAAAAEQRLSHPAAEAIVRAAIDRGLTIPEREDSRYRVGLGVEARLRDGTVLVGSERFLVRHNLAIPAPVREAAVRAGRNGATMVFVAWNGAVVGAVAYADHPRPEAVEVLKELRQRGIKRVVMVTGDHPLVARAVARQVGIDQVEAEAFPEQKTEIVRKLQCDGYVVGVVGDGINDSPALAYADVSISLKGGTDLARETADVVLHGDLRGIVEAIDLSHATMALVRQNLALVGVPNLAGIVLASTGMIGPLASTAINNGSAALAAVNALRPLLGSGSGSDGAAEDGEVSHGIVGEAGRT